MTTSLALFAQRLAAEPPLRLATRAWIKRFSSSARAHARWDCADRPQYLLGVLRAADQAREQGLDAVTVAEFGVAGGAGLLRMQQYAQWVGRETGVTIHVLGFDTGEGLPAGTGDYRDHPEIWSPGDYKMDWDALRPRLAQGTRLVLGDVAQTVPELLAAGLPAPLGFISVDVDFYSSTRAALQILSHPRRHNLMRVVMYLDDTETLLYHRHAGELLAIDEFNAENTRVKIDRWRGIRKNRPFPEHGWLGHMWAAYDFDAIERDGRRQRAQQVLDLNNAHNMD